MFIAGIVLLGLIAVGLALFFYFVRQRQANEVARVEREREERRRRAAERRAREALEAQQRVASIPIKSVVPVFIMQPDGRLILAAHTAFEAADKDACGSDGSDDGSEPKPAAPPPAPRSGSMRRSHSFPWRRQPSRSSTDVELPASSGGAVQPPPPPPV
jgi:hypothetical protein